MCNAVHGAALTWPQATGPQLHETSIGANSTSKSASEEVRRGTVTRPTHFTSVLLTQDTMLASGENATQSWLPSGATWSCIQIKPSNASASHDDGAADLQSGMLKVDEFDDAVASADCNEVARGARVHRHGHLTNITKRSRGEFRCTHMFQTENLTHCIFLPVKPHDGGWEKA
jgi:hypothetical protein